MQLTSNHSLNDQLELTLEVPLDPTYLDFHPDIPVHCFGLASLAGTRPGLHPDAPPSADVEWNAAAYPRLTLPADGTLPHPLYYDFNASYEGPFTSYIDNDGSTKTVGIYEFSIESHVTVECWSSSDDDTDSSDDDWDSGGTCGQPRTDTIFDNP
jgi:hypothetical protein